MKNRCFIDGNVFESETATFSREIIEAKDLSRQEKLEAAEQLHRVANLIAETV